MCVVGLPVFYWASIRRPTALAYQAAGPRIGINTKICQYLGTVIKERGKTASLCATDREIMLPELVGRNLTVFTTVWFWVQQFLKIGCGGRGRRFR